MNNFLDTPQAQRKRRNRNIIALVVCVACTMFLIATVFPVVRFFTTSAISIAKNESITTELQRQVTKMNRHLPQIVDEGVRLDSIALTDKRTVKYYSTLLKFDSEEVLFNTPAAKEAIIQKLRANRQTMSFFIDNNILMYYCYYDKNNKFITEIKITPSLYK